MDIDAELVSVTLPRKRTDAQMKGCLDKRFGATVVEPVS
jgi:hypothetical protein